MEIYLYIYMGTMMSMMLLFTWLSRIRCSNVGSHAIIFKSLHLIRLMQPLTFQTKMGSAAFSKVSVFNLQNVV